MNGKSIEKERTASWQCVDSPVTNGARSCYSVSGWAKEGKMRYIVEQGGEVAAEGRVKRGKSGAFAQLERCQGNEKESSSVRERGGGGRPV